MIQMHMSESDQCPVCKTGNAEEWEHFLLECPALFSASTAPWYYFHATVA
jgi:RNA polymerase subunit RPABC4/transcription elongation factor Spt4